MKKILRKSIIPALALILVFSFVGCSQTQDSTPVTDNDNASTANNEDTTTDNEDTTTDNEDTTVTESEDTPTGIITVSGSTSVEKVGVALGDEYMALYPDVTFTYEGIGSSAGVKNANDGTTMIGTASRNIKDSEKELGLTEQVLGFDGIAVIVHPLNQIANLTVEQVQKIYLGEITNWKDVGGNDAQIAVISREDGSGTRGAYEEIVDFEGALTSTAIIKDGNGNVQATVAGNELAIGYVSFTYVDDTVKGILIEGATPTVEAVLDGTYKISRPFNIIYHEANLSDAAVNWLEWIKTDEAKDIISEKGAIPLQ